MNISAVRLLLLFILIYSHAKPQGRKEDDSSTTLWIANETSTNATGLDVTTIMQHEEYINHNMYDWKTIAVRVGIGGACAFGFVAFFTVLYSCFNRGSSKKLRNQVGRGEQEQPAKKTSSIPSGSYEKGEVKRSPSEGFDTDEQEHTNTPAITDSRVSSFSTTSATSAPVVSKQTSQEQ